MSTVPRLTTEIYTVERRERDVVALQKSALIEKLGFRADQTIAGADIEYLGQNEFHLTVPFNREEKNRVSVLNRLLNETVEEAYNLLIFSVA